MKAIINAKLVFPDRIVPNGTILIENGKIIASGTIEIPDGAEIIDAKGLYAGPGFVDEHLHGYMQYGESYDVIENCEMVAASHLKHGTTTMTPSAAYSLPHDAFISVINQCNALIERGDTTIAGIHYEGPFTNPKYGSNSEQAWKYSDALCDEIFGLGGKNVIHCTYAPELECAPKLEQLLISRGIVADIGHTGSDPDNLVRAFAHGAKIVTHLYDAMGHYLGAEGGAKGTGDVQNAVSQICLATPGLYYELICDCMGAHVTKYNAAMAYRAAGEDHIILVTDCTSSRDSGGTVNAALTGKRFTGDDVNYNSRNQLSGSRLTMNRACVNFMNMTGADVRVAFKCAATNPAKALGLFDKVGSIEPGREANIVLVDEQFEVNAVYFRGNEVQELRH